MKAMSSRLTNDLISDSASFATYTHNMWIGVDYLKCCMLA